MNKTKNKRLKYSIYEMTIEQIAKELGITTNDVEVILRRVLNKIRKNLGLKK